MQLNLVTSVTLKNTYTFYVFTLSIQLTTKFIIKVNINNQKLIRPSQTGECSLVEYRYEFFSVYWKMYDSNTIVSTKVWCGRSGLQLSEEIARQNASTNTLLHTHTEISRRRVFQEISPSSSLWQTTFGWQTAVPTYFRGILTVSAPKHICIPTTVQHRARSYKLPDTFSSQSLASLLNRTLTEANG